MEELRVSLSHAMSDDQIDSRSEDSHLAFPAPFATILSPISSAVLASAPNGRYIYANAAAEALLGYRRDELSGRHITEISIAPEDWFHDQFESLERQLVWSGSIRHRCASGDLIPLHLNCAVCPSNDGRLAYLAFLHPAPTDFVEPARLQSKLQPGLAGSDFRTLVLMAEGLTDKEIAILTGMSVWTVNQQVHRILSALEVHSRTAACVVAVKAGLIA
jgi:PAS domain S-box-containing protein